jgi:outer membrane protein
MNDELTMQRRANTIRASLLVLAALALSAATATVGHCAPPLALPDRPLTLEDCTAIALARNPQVTASEQNVISARAGVTRARSSYYPQLSLSAVEGLTGASAFASQQNGLSAAGDHTREELDLALGVTLWQQGRQEAVGESEALVRAADFGHASTTQALVEQVASDYYGVLAAQQLVGVAQAGVESAQGNLGQVKAFVDAGSAADVDVFAADDDLARAQLDLIDARSNARLAMAALKNTMGLSPATALELAESPARGDEEVPSLQEAIAIALEARPELAADRASLQANRYALAQAEIERGPVTGVTAGYDQGYAHWSDRTSSWEVLLTVSLPLLDGGATKAAAAQARARLKGSEADLESRINQVELEVEQALVELERARERVQASAVSVTAAEARLAAADGKYQNGVGILLEVIDARVAVTNARASQVQARYDYQTALVALDRAMGTLGVPAPPKQNGAADDRGD